MVGHDDVMDKYVVGVTMQTVVGELAIVFLAEVARRAVRRSIKRKRNIFRLLRFLLLVRLALLFHVILVLLRSGERK